jgi:hypothetical protein
LLCATLLQCSLLNAQVPFRDKVTGGVLDQYFEEDLSDPRYEHAYSTGPSNEYQEWAQSFTAGTNGTLSHVEVYGSAPWWEEVTLNVHDFSGSIPREIVGSRTLMPGNPSTFRWITFDLRAESIRMRPAEKFAISLSGRFGWWASMWGDPVRTYDRGDIYNRILMDSQGGVPYNDSQWYLLAGSHANNDFLFRTYLNPIPEPTTAAHVIIGALLLIPVAASRRRARIRHG